MTDQRFYPFVVPSCPDRQFLSENSRAPLDDQRRVIEGASGHKVGSASITCWNGGRFSALTMQLLLSGGKKSGEVSDQDVREKAYDIWLREGKPEGRDIAHWEMARKALIESSDIPVQTQAKVRSGKNQN